MESCPDMEFLGSVLQETLRMTPPHPVASPLSFERSTEVGKVTIQANDMFLINIWGLHHNTTQW